MEPEQLGGPDVVAVQCDISLVASVNTIHDFSDIAASVMTLSGVPEASLSDKTISNLAYTIIQGFLSLRVICQVISDLTGGSETI